TRWPDTIPDRQTNTGYPIDSAVLASDLHRNGVDINGIDRTAERARQRDGQNATAGAKVKGTANFDATGEQAVDRYQATARRPVMRGSKSAAGIDFDCVSVETHTLTVMATVDDEPAGAHGGQTALRD